MCALIGKKTKNALVVGSHSFLKRKMHKLYLLVVASVRRHKLSHWTKDKMYSRYSRAASLSQFVLPATSTSWSVFTVHQVGERVQSIAPLPPACTLQAPRLSNTIPHHYCVSCTDSRSHTCRSSPCHKNIFLGRAFRCTAPNAWNSLPSIVTAADSLASFKPTLKDSIAKPMQLNQSTMPPCMAIGMQRL